MHHDNQYILQLKYLKVESQLAGVVNGMQILLLL